VQPAPVWEVEDLGALALHQQDPCWWIATCSRKPASPTQLAATTKGGGHCSAAVAGPPTSDPA